MFYPIIYIYIRLLVTFNLGWKYHAISDWYSLVVPLTTAILVG